MVSVMHACYELVENELRKSTADLESARYEAGIFHHILPQLNTVRDGYRALSEPFAKIEKQLCPMSVFLPRLDQLSSFFADSQGNRLNNSLTLDGVHEFPEPEDHGDERWQRVKALCAAAILVMLNLPVQSTQQEKLWDELQGYLRQPGVRVKPEELKALRRHLPGAFAAEVSVGEARRIFHRLKAWLHSSGKHNSPHMPQGLELSLLSFAIDCSGVECQGTDVGYEDTKIWVGSQRPINTLDALAIMHERWRVFNARLEVIRGEQVRLELEYAKPCFEDDMDWNALYGGLLNAASLEEGSFTRGNLVHLGMLLLGSGEIKMAERRFFRAEPTGSVGIEWLSSSRLCIDWTVLIEN
jgi:hypothetical protein